MGKTIIPRNKALVKIVKDDEYDDKYFNEKHNNGMDTDEDHYGYWKKKIKVWHPSIKIAILPHAYKKMFYYVNAVNGEISGLMIVSLKDEIYTIEDVYLLKQRCSSAYTDLNKDAIASFIAEYASKGGDPLKIRGWWHSHVNMSCFWSGTDEATAQRFGFDKENLPEWWVSVVVNKSYDMRGRVDKYAPIHDCLKDDIKPYISLGEDKGLQEECIKEVKEKVREFIYKYKHFKKSKYCWDEERIQKKWDKWNKKNEQRRKKGRLITNGTVLFYGGQRFVWNGTTFRSAKGDSYPSSTVKENNNLGCGVGGVIRDLMLSKDGVQAD